MSMNLRSNEVELYQTPTWVAFVAKYDCKGKERSLQETKYIYSEWVQSTLQGRWANSDDFEAAHKSIEAHLESLDSVKSFYII